MAPSNKVEHSSLGHRVLEYFRQNTRAMDSADGVARFWVGEHVGLVERCLVDLHHQGLLERRTIAGTNFYSLQERSQPAVVDGPHTDGVDDSSSRSRHIHDAGDGYLSALTSLIRTIEDLRPETREHSTRVAETAALIAQAMAVPASRIQLLKRTAALHGVGRLLGSSVNGSGQSSDDRTSAGAFLATERMLAPIASLHDVREIILRASDWCDAGRSLLEVSHVVIPVESRILAVSEEFVRGTAGKRRDSETTREVLERIRAQSDQQHDSGVVRTLCRLVEHRKVRR